VRDSHERIRGDFSAGDVELVGDAAGLGAAGRVSDPAGRHFYSIVAHFASFADLSVDEGPLGAYFGQNSVFLLMTLLLVCPALSMRLLAEERRSGTIEALMTAPVGSAGVVLGKYAAALHLRADLDPDRALRRDLAQDRQRGLAGHAVELLGLFLVGAQYLAIGVLSSSLSKSQFVALLITVLIQFGLFVLGIGEYIFDPGPRCTTCARTCRWPDTWRTSRRASSTPGACCTTALWRSFACF
jgi:ABC-2 type transport system permease protein